MPRLPRVSPLILLLLGCSSSISNGPGPGDPGSGGTGGGSAGGSGGSGSTMDSGNPLPSGGLSEDGGNCGVQKFAIDRKPPDLLIVLDASGSMDDPFAGGSSKWSTVTSTLQQTVANTQADINWGLEIFPSSAIDLTCDKGGDVVVPVGPMNGNAIAQGMAARTERSGGTPTAGAERAGLQHLLAAHRPNPQFIMLATDGLPTCSPLPETCACPAGQMLKTTPGQPGQCCTSNNGATSCTSCPSDPTAVAITAIQQAADQGIHTFVIGVGTDSTSNANLDAMAVAGKEPRPGSPRFYQASNQADLVTAINSISRGIISCTFTLAMPPPDPSYIEILVNGMKVPRDRMHVEGWDYAGMGFTSIQFYGNVCQQLQASTAGTVTAVYGCTIN